MMHCYVIFAINCLMSLVLLKQDPIVGFVAFLVVVIILLLIKAATYDPTKWYGEMKCGKCGYDWKSRRKTPPASCPNCRSKLISRITGNNTMIGQAAERSQGSKYDPPGQPSQPGTQLRLKAISKERPPHEILNVPESATLEEITSAYKRMAQVYHPDKVASLAPEFRELAERRMKELNAALASLKSRVHSITVTSDAGEDQRTVSQESIHPRVCDELRDDVLFIVTDMGRASTSVLQRRLSIGYERASTILNQMEQDGLIGPAQGSKPRKVLQPAYELRRQLENQKWIDG